MASAAAEERQRKSEAETGMLIGARGGGDVMKDGVAREVVRMEREAVIPIIKPKLVMKLADLIGKPKRSSRSKRL